MDDQKRKLITERNEKATNEWFKLSGFAGEKLDKGSGKAGKSVDWHFAKDDIEILCEVKTIFSGGQSGANYEQAERHRLNLKQQFDRNLEEAKAAGQTLLTTRDELNYLNNKNPTLRHKMPKLRKKEEFNKYTEDIYYNLLNDSEINSLPFDITISIDAMYVVYGEQRNQFLDWLKGYLKWAEQNHSDDLFHSTASFVFRPTTRTADGKKSPQIEAFVQIMGPFSGWTALRVGSIVNIVAYNEDGIKRNITDAIAQLKASAPKMEKADSLRILGLWSASSYVVFPMILYMDWEDEKSGEIRQRYYMLDWAFQDYPNLDAIVLFEYRKDNEELSPFGFVITNPKTIHKEEILKKYITANCKFLVGIDSDPLGDNS